ARASDIRSPALRCWSACSGVGCAGENAAEDCRIEISVASGATPTTPSGPPGGGPGTNGWAVLAAGAPADRAYGAGARGGRRGWWARRVHGPRLGLGGRGRGAGRGGLGRSPRRRRGRAHAGGLGGGPSRRVRRCGPDDAGHHRAVVVAITQPAARQALHI